MVAIALEKLAKLVVADADDQEVGQPAAENEQVD